MRNATLSLSLAMRASFNEMKNLNESTNKRTLQGKRANGII